MCVCVCVWTVVSLLFLFAFLFYFCQFSVDPALVITGCFQQVNWLSLTKSSNSSGHRTCSLNIDYCFFYFSVTGWYRNFKIQRVPSALYRHQKPTEQRFRFILRGLCCDCACASCPFRHFVICRSRQGHPTYRGLLQVYV